MEEEVCNYNEEHNGNADNCLPIDLDHQYNNFGIVGVEEAVGEYPAKMIDLCGIAEAAEILPGVFQYDGLYVLPLDNNQLAQSLQRYKDFQIQIIEHDIKMFQRFQGMIIDLFQIFSKLFINYGFS